MDLGFTAGSIILSFIAESKSYAVMYRASSICMVLFLIIYGYSLVKAKKSEGNENGLEEGIS